MHPRESIVTDVELKLRDAVNEWMRSDEVGELTSLEYIRVVNTVVGGLIAGAVKYGIREERHGDTDKPGGLAGDTDD